MPRHAFTVEEANSLIPFLEDLLSRIEQHQLEIRQRDAQLQVLNLLWGGKLLNEDNPDHVEALGHRTVILNVAREIQRLLDQEIVARGIRVPQGGLEYGLMDFPTTWQGRWVYLCWHRGEPAITAWHEVQTGFAGRQPLTLEHQRRMGREDDPRDLDDSLLDL